MARLTFQSILQWSEDDCRDFLAKMRWPRGPICPKCGAKEPYTITRKSATKNLVRSLYKCRDCKKQFTVTVGTIFEDSHIPLSKWLAALFLMCASKKGMSAHQLFRMLDIGSYRTAWFMAHRIREAMRDKGILEPLKGIVEIDETYVGGKQRGHKVWRENIQDEIQMGIRPKPSHPRMDKAIVFGMLERDGKVRTVRVKATTAKTLHPIIREYVDQLDAHVISDGHPAYRLLKKWLRHDVIDHETEYVRGSVHTQGIENYWSLLKRGIIGVFHHVSQDHLPMYLSEFEYRFNRRKMADPERFAALMMQTQGRLLWYCTTPQPENPFR